jgi:hypothetical protein
LTEKKLKKIRLGLNYKFMVDKHTTSFLPNLPCTLQNTSFAMLLLCKVCVHSNMLRRVFSRFQSSTIWNLISSLF